MRKLFLFAAIVFLGACARRHPPVVAPQAGPATVKPQARLADVLPRPAVLEPRDGEFVVTPQTVIAADRSNADVARVADMVAQYIKRASGLAVKPSSGAAASTISLSITAGENPEAYQITVAPDRISVVGSGPAGLFYGFQTLRQLMPVAGEYEALLFQQPRPFAIPAVHIADEPRFEWRGAMLDVARHFFSVDDVKERESWNNYMKAYEECLSETSTETAPWYVVPADDKATTRLIVSRIILDAFKDLKLEYPQLSPERLQELRKIRKLLTK